MSNSMKNLFDITIDKDCVKAIEIYDNLENLLYDSYYFMLLIYKLNNYYMFHSYRGIIFQNK